MLKVKGKVPSRSVKMPRRVQDLTRGQLAVIVEEGDYFGSHVLMVTHRGSRWVVCLDDATVTCSSEVWHALCRLVKPSDKVTLTNQDD